MAQGRRLTDWQIEMIRLAYAETGSTSYAAQQAGCAYNTAKSYITSNQDELTELRNQKKADVVAQVHILRIRVLEEMHNTTRLKDASLGELTNAFGVLTDKHQLLTGEATNRSETTHVDSPRAEIARRIDELAARRRARSVAGEPDGRGSEGASA